VTKFYGAVRAVDSVTFGLSPGEIVSILGPSGCGKTSLLRLIAGFEHVDDGEILVSGKTVSSRSSHLAPDQRNIGMVFQEYALFPHLTVSQNVSFGLQKLDASDRRKRLDEVLALVRLTELKDRYPNELSGGQQQRVALARTLAPRPVTVLLDEPFSNLDAGMRTEMRREVQAILREYGMATILVTHDREEAFAVADRVGVMRDGRLEQIDKPGVVYTQPVNPFVATMTGACDFLEGCVEGERIVTEVGRLPFSASEGLPKDGAKVEVLVHPDDFHVSRDPDGDALVESREFRGGETILAIKLPSGRTVRCRQLSYSDLAPGMKVRLIPTSRAPFAVFLEA
jgi:iron(III) transport system ATP-binding protein